MTAQPTLVAFNPEDDLTPRVTADGRYVVFVSERNGNLDVWVRDYGAAPPPPASTGLRGRMRTATTGLRARVGTATVATATAGQVRGSIYPLTQNPADDFDPALFPDGQRLVFVSRRSDAKGDLFLMRGFGPGTPDIERLTDASTQDRQPVVAPAGQRIFFTAAAGIGLEFIAELDLDDRLVKRRSPTPGFDPAVSPDGRYLVYTAPARASLKPHPHLVALRLTDDGTESATVALTLGATPAGFSTFLPATEKPYALAFVRFPDDDNADGKVDARDQASLWRLDVDLDALFAERGPPPRPYPLTDGASDELFPDAGDGQLYFTQGRDQQDILRVRPSGIFPEWVDAKDYLDRAKAIDDPRTRWFALRVAVARAGPDSEVGARALLAIARLNLARGKVAIARRDFVRLERACASAAPPTLRWVIGGRAQVAIAALDRASALRDATTASERSAIVRKTRRRVEAIGRVYEGVRAVEARIELEQAELLIAEGVRVRAVQTLEALSRGQDVPAEVAARAMLRRVELLGIVHDAARLSAAYAQVTERFPGEGAVVAEAAQRLVGVFLDGLPPEEGHWLRVDALRRVVYQHPPGPIRRAARWQLVRELDASDALESAALELAQLVDESSDRFDQARALRALAEVDERRGQGQAAVRSWRTILRAYSDLPGLASAARGAISRVNLADAAARERQGDLKGARSAYARVIENDESVVQAHRRYIALSAQLGYAEAVLDVAAARAERSSGTPIARYAHALALTWQSPPALDEALEEVEAAIDLNPQFTHAYLLRGWIREMQELEEPGWFVEGLTVLYERVIESVVAIFASDQEDVGQLGLLELAIEDYKTALRLNNEAQDPRTEAEILLNLGNGHYRLADDTNDTANMRQAFDRYTQVVTYGYRFDAPEAEMAFWERFGRSASWIGEYALSAMATRRALVLSEQLSEDARRAQQLGNLALAYDQANEDAYAKQTRRLLVNLGQADAEAGRVAVLLREKARARLETPDDRTVAGFEQVLLDLASARQALSTLTSDPRELPSVWLALEANNPTSAQYGFGPRAERNVNLALAERTHRTLGDVGRADALASQRADLARERYEKVPGGVYGFGYRWPTTIFQVRERFGLLMDQARRARAAGRWNEAWGALQTADQWLTRTIESGRISGAKSWLWLERARWCAVTAAWQASAREQGWPLAPGEPPVRQTLDRGRDAVARAVTLVKTASTAKPLGTKEREQAWSTPLSERLAGPLDTPAAVTLTASVARRRPTLLPVLMRSRALAARLSYVEGLYAWARSRSVGGRTPLTDTATRALVQGGLRSLFDRLDASVAWRLKAQYDFARSIRLAAEGGPGLGHRALVSSLAAWADVAPAGVDPEVPAQARKEAIALAEAIGDLGLAWSVRLAQAVAQDAELPEAEGLWPPFIAPDLPLVDLLLSRTASRALTAGEVDDGFDALERRLTLRQAMGPLVEHDEPAEPRDQERTRTLRRRLDALLAARTALSIVERPTPTEWATLWRDVERARKGFVEAVEDAGTLSTGARARVLGENQLADFLAAEDVGPREGLLMPAELGGRLQLLFIDGSTTAAERRVAVATGYAFESVRQRLERVRTALRAGRRPPQAELDDLRQRLFGPLQARLANKRALVVVAGFLGGTIPQVILPDGPAIAHVFAATGLATARSALQVGGEGLLRIAGSTAPLVDAPTLAPEDAVAFRARAVAQRAKVDAANEPRQDPPPVVTLPHRVFDTVIVEAPVALEPAAPSRSTVRVVPPPPDEAPADAFRQEVPLARLTMAATTLYLARVDGSARSPAALRLDAALAPAGYASTVVVPAVVPQVTVRALLDALLARGDESPAAALARAQRNLRGRDPRVDLAFLVGSPGLDAESVRVFANKQLKGAQNRAVTALSRGQYEAAVPRLERWIRLLLAAGKTRRIKGVYGALIGVLRDRMSPPRPAQAADVQRQMMSFMAERKVPAVRLAQARIDLAYLVSRAGDYATSDAEFAAAAEALKALNRPDLEAQALYFQSLSMRERRAYDESASLIERAIKKFEAAGVYQRKLPPLVAQEALQQAGELYLVALSDPVRARRAYRRVQRYATKPAPKVKVEIDLARVARRSGAFDEAAAHAERAREEANRLELPSLELDAQIEAANVAWYQGDYRLGQVLCQRSLQKAAEQATKQSKRGRGRLPSKTLDKQRVYALSVCGLVAMSQRNFAGAVDFLEEARRIAGQIEDEREVATQNNNLGRVYLEFGRLRPAVAAFRRALAIDRRLDDRYALAYDLRNLGRALALLGVRDKARRALTQALAYAREVRDANNELRARFALAELDLDEGRDEAAKAGLQIALPLAERLQVQELAWQIHRNLGRLARKAGNLAEADASLTRAVGIVRTITGRSAPSDFGPTRFEAFEDLMRLKLAEGDKAGAFRVAEEARHLRRAELLTDGRLVLGPAAEAARTLRTTPTGTVAEAARAQLQAIAPRFAQLWRTTNTATLAAQLPPDAAVVQYEMTRTELVIFVLADGRLEVETVDVSSAELRAALAAYGAQLVARADLTRSAGQLADWVYRPIQARLEGKERVAFVLQDALRYLALAALPAPDGGQLIDSHQIVQALDTSSAVAALVAPDGPIDGAMVALGAAPSPPDTEERPLPFAERELQVIKEEFPQVRVVRGASVTRQRLLAELARRRRVFHFAGHTYFGGSADADRFPDLLGGQLRTADGGVTMLDLLAGVGVSQRTVGADLVVLSSCASLVGADMSSATGEDLLSMAETLHLAGANAVVGSTLSVDDVSTALLMKRFYRAARRQPIAAALRDAQRATRAQYGHPAWWAGFALWVGR